MPNNIALLIGNSQYRELDPLECCLNDVAMMRQLLEHCKKFSQIINYNDWSIDEAKEHMRKLASETCELDELFFYFSGHGYSNDADFFMCFKDFTVASPHTSGLSRQELHDILRSFNASLVVNVIDACNAGRNLIKSDYEPIAKQAAFQNFIQFSACSTDQFAQAGSELSKFTREVISASLRKESGVVYYTDVETGLRDAFLSNRNQTPHFIKQGNSQEVFCSDAQQLGPLRSRSVNEPESVQAFTANAVQSEFDRTEAMLTSIEKEIPTVEAAQKFIDEISNQVLRRGELPQELCRFFECRIVHYDDYTNVRSEKSIVRLLQGRERADAFVSCGVTREKRRESIWTTPLLPLYTPIYDETAYLDNNCELRRVHARMYLEPKFKFLKRILTEVVFLPSIRDCLVLTTTTFEKRSGWASFQENADGVQWKWSECRWDEQPSSAAGRILGDPFQTAQTYLIQLAGTE